MEAVDCRAVSLASIEGKGDLGGANKEDADEAVDVLVGSTSACFGASKGFMPSEAEEKGFGLLAS